MFDVTSVWQAGCNGKPLLIARYVGNRLLECFRPDADFWTPTGNSAPAPLLFQPYATPVLELGTVSPASPLQLLFRRKGMSSWHRLDVDPNGQVTVDGNVVSQEEVDCIVKWVEAGEAAVRYREADLQLSEHPVADLTTDSVTQLQNLTAYETAVAPLFVLGLTSYEQQWLTDPAATLDVLRAFADGLRDVSAYHLVGGRFAVEVDGAQQAQAVEERLLAYTKTCAAGPAMVFKGEYVEQPVDKSWNGWRVT